MGWVRGIACRNAFLTRRIGSIPNGQFKFDIVEARQQRFGSQAGVLQFSGFEKADGRSVILSRYLYGQVPGRVVGLMHKRLVGVDQTPDFYHTQQERDNEQDQNDREFNQSSTALAASVWNPDWPDWQCLTKNGHGHFTNTGAKGPTEPIPATPDTTQAEVGN